MIWRLHEEVQPVKSEMILQQFAVNEPVLSSPLYTLHGLTYSRVARPAAFFLLYGGFFHAHIQKSGLATRD